MSESAATTIPDPSAATPAPAADPTKQPENGQASFMDRVKTDPAFAENTVKNLQRQVRERDARLKPLEPLENVAKGTFGDVATGVSKIVGLADRAYAIEKNPEWNRRVQEMIDGKVTPQGAPDADEYLTPEEKKINLLEANQRRLEARLAEQDTRVSRTQIQSHLETVFASDLGKAIPPEERQNVVAALEQQFGVWSRTEEGRRQLANFTPKSARLVIINHLDEAGLLQDVYGRMARESQAKLAGAETDSPSLSSRRVDEGTPDFKGDHAAAIKWAAQKWVPAEDRQKLGSGW